MGRRPPENIVYTYYDDVGGDNFRCKHCTHVIKCCGSPSNLMKHLATHKDEHSKYLNRKKETERQEADERERNERKRQLAQVQVTEHVTIRNRTKLCASHPRQKLFVHNLIGCAAQSSQAINFYTRQDLPNRPAPFRKLVEHLDNTVHIPSKQTLTRCMHIASDEYKQKFLEVFARCKSTPDNTRACWQGRRRRL